MRVGAGARQRWQAAPTITTPVGEQSPCPRTIVLVSGSGLSGEDLGLEEVSCGARAARKKEEEQEGWQLG